MEVYPFDFCNNRKEEQIDKNLRIVNYDDNLWQCDNYDDLSYKNHFVRESFNVNCTLSPCNCTIESLPDELLTEIFSFLDRRDRLACALVSGRWQRALDCPSLWKNMTISLDTDLIGKFINSNWIFNVRIYLLIFVVCWLNLIYKNLVRCY